MTRDEILNMEAGREMDAAVAAGPMQLEVLGNVRTARDPCGGYDVPYKRLDSGLLLPVYVAHCACDVGEREPNDADYWGHYAACLRVVPRYSQDWAAAGEVVEKMLLSMWDVSFDARRRKDQTYWDVSFYNEEEWLQARADDQASMPLAICRAALLATLEADND